MTTHSIILAWRILWTEEPGGLQSMGLPRVRHDWVTEQAHIFRALLSSRQNWVASRDFLYACCSHIQPFWLLTPCTTVVHLLQLMNLYQRYYYSKSIVYIEIHYWCCAVYSFNKGRITLPTTVVSNRQNITILNISCVTPMYPSLPAKPWKPLILLLSVQFCLFHNIIYLVPYRMKPFQIGFFQLVILT